MGAVGFEHVCLRIVKARPIAHHWRHPHPWGSRRDGRKRAHVHRDFGENGSVQDVINWVLAPARSPIYNHAHPYLIRKHAVPRDKGK